MVKHLLRLARTVKWLPTPAMSDREIWQHSALLAVIKEVIFVKTTLWRPREHLSCREFRPSPRSSPEGVSPPPPPPRAVWGGGWTRPGRAAPAGCRKHNSPPPPSWWWRWSTPWCQCEAITNAIQALSIEPVNYWRRKHCPWFSCS